MVLDESVCLELLRSTSLGRVGLSVSALPVVLPVRFVVTDHRLLMCPADVPVSAEEEALRREVHAFRIPGTVACLQADGQHAEEGSGWSVQATGRLEPASEEETDLARRSLGGTDTIFECCGLTIELLSGRLIRVN
jgi:hypothetical protein